MLDKAKYAGKWKVTVMYGSWVWWCRPEFPAFHRQRPRSASLDLCSENSQTPPPPAPPPVPAPPPPAPAPPPQQRQQRHQHKSYSRPCERPSLPNRCQLRASRVLAVCSTHSLHSVILQEQKFTLFRSISVGVFFNITIIPLSNS